MPRIKDEFLDCAVYLFPDLASARDGTGVGATGFAISLHSAALPPDWAYGYIVTNRHNVDSSQSDELIARINLKDGGHDFLTLKKSDWSVASSDDLAVCEIGPDPSHKIRLISDSMFLSEESCKHRIGLGDDVYMVGRFVGHEGRLANNPAARFGMISQMPIEPVEFLGHRQDAFLVDIRSIAGYSGSPVIAREKIQSMSGKYMEWLLGVDCGHLSRRLPVLDDHGTSTGQTVEVDSGMSVVIPCWKLVKLLETEELREQRAVAEKDALEKIAKSGPVQERK